MWRVTQVSGQWVPKHRTGYWKGPTTICCKPVRRYHQLMAGNDSNNIDVQHYAHDTRTRNRRRKPVPKTGTINPHENRARRIRYQNLVPEKFGTELHVRRVRNRKPTGFWRRFLVSVSRALGHMAVHSATHRPGNNNMHTTDLCKIPGNITWHKWPRFVLIQIKKTHLSKSVGALPSRFTFRPYHV